MTLEYIERMSDYLFNAFLRRLNINTARNMKPGGHDAASGDLVQATASEVMDRFEAYDPRWKSERKRLMGVLRKKVRINGRKNFALIKTEWDKLGTG